MAERVAARIGAAGQLLKRLQAPFPWRWWVKDEPWGARFSVVSNCTELKIRIYFWLCFIGSFFDDRYHVI